MATLIINGIDGQEFEFPTAVSWHIDDDGYLHIAEAVDKVVRRDVGAPKTPKTRPLASFAPRHWAAVRVVRPSVGPFSE